MRFNTGLVCILTFLMVLGSNRSDDSCEYNPIRVYAWAKIEGYDAVKCHNIFFDTTIRDEILPMVTKFSIPSITILNSSLPGINFNIFKGLNLTDLKIEANISVIQEYAFENCNISTVNLDNNGIQVIKDRGFNSSNLKTLSLKNNSLAQILEKNFAGAYKLLVLNLGNNRIVDIQPYAFKDLQSLEEIDLSHNRLSSLPSNIFRTTKYLLSVSLNDNRFKTVSTDLFIENSQLRFLELQHNYLTVFDGRNLPKSLINLMLSNNVITFFNVSNLTSLSSLRLDNNKITSIENSILNVTNLKFLSLNYNCLGSYLSEKTFEHLDLYSLELSANNITKFSPTHFNGMKKLHSLSMAQNYLTIVDFSNITVDLKYLNFSSNFINDIKNISLLKNLISLDMRYNELEQIPFNLFDGMFILSKLWLGHNSIKYFQTGCFRDLKSLKTLDLSYNKLNSIPSSVLNRLSVLQELNLSHNNLKDLDEDLFHSNQNLRYISIANNNISKIDVKRILSYAKWLTEIDVNGNHLSCNDLIEILQIRGMKLTDSSSLNVSNVNGVPCNGTDDSENLDLNRYYREVFLVMNRTMLTTNEISVKFNVVNVLLFLVLFLICVKVIHEKCSENIRAAKQFIYQRTSSEQELHSNVSHSV